MQIVVIPGCFLNNCHNERPLLEFWLGKQKLRYLTWARPARPKHCKKMGTTWELGCSFVNSSHCSTVSCQSVHSISNGLWTGSISNSRSTKCWMGLVLSFGLLVHSRSEQAWGWVWSFSAGKVDIYNRLYRERGLGRIEVFAKACLKNAQGLLSNRVSMRQNFNPSHQV